MVLDCVFFNPDKRIFLQKRAPDRRLFPGHWEVSGGHVDEGESVLSALRRELKEETNFELLEVAAYLGSSDWEVIPQWQKSGDNPNKRSFVFLLTVGGELKVETDKITEYKWVSQRDIKDMVKAGERIDDYMVELLHQAFQF